MVRAHSRCLLRLWAVIAVVAEGCFLNPQPEDSNNNRPNADSFGGTASVSEGGGTGTSNSTGPGGSPARGGASAAAASGGLGGSTAGNFAGSGNVQPNAGASAAGTPNADATGAGTAGVVNHRMFAGSAGTAATMAAGAPIDGP
jgi:hypothetical protein